MTDTKIGRLEGKYKENELEILVQITSLDLEVLYSKEIEAYFEERGAKFDSIRCNPLYDIILVGVKK